jgi:hypothetical protein
MSMHTHLEKDSGEKFAIGFRYISPDLNSGETITGAVVTGASGLTLVGDPVIVGNEVRQMISGGTLGQSYTVTFTVTISTGHIYVDYFEVKII